MPFDAAKDALIFEAKWDALACVKLVRLARGAAAVPDPAPWHKGGSGPGVFFADRWSTALARFVSTANNLPAGSRAALVVDHDPPDASGQAPATSITTRLVAESIVVAMPPLPVAGGLHSLPAVRGVILGVWLMPDNAANGAIERFLLDPANPPNPVAGFTLQAMQQARALGADVQPVNEAKALVRSYLAWHDKPDDDYGAAVGKNRFSPPTPLVGQFVGWFDAMFP